VDILDLDHAQQPLVSNFSLCLRMLRNPRWRGLLFADISAIMLRNREQYLRPLLEATDVHNLLVYGSDYPLPCGTFVVVLLCSLVGVPDVPLHMSVNTFLVCV
jgi:hypothetical protein